MNKITPRLLLASRSPRRRELLERAGVEFDVEASDIDENFLADLSLRDNLLQLAERKAKALSTRYPQHWILGCDTAVAVPHSESRIPSAVKIGSELVLGKPQDQIEAASMLHLLSGKTHRVLSGYALIDPNGATRAGEVVVTEVEFVKLTDKAIALYLMSGESSDKAGAYAIQGCAAAFVRRISGSYTNVVGLPVAEVLESLKQFGLSGVE